MQQAAFVPCSLVLKLFIFLLSFSILPKCFSFTVYNVLSLLFTMLVTFYYYICTISCILSINKIICLLRNVSGKWTIEAGISTASMSNFAYYYYAYYTTSIVIRIVLQPSVWKDVDAIEIGLCQVTSGCRWVFVG